MFGDENLVRMALAGVERKVWLGVRGVSGALGIATGTGSAESIGIAACFSGELLRLSMRGPAAWLCLGFDMEGRLGAWKMGFACAVPSSDAKPLKV